uniref:Uncharacterized protein n=1 Tax=Oryza meridionalis TaxID=40149 RepID=A0A0E0EWT2_9ORYZ
MGDKPRCPTTISADADATAPPSPSTNTTSEHHEDSGELPEEFRVREPPPPSLFPYPLSPSIEEDDIVYTEDLEYMSTPCPSPPSDLDDLSQPEDPPSPFLLHPAFVYDDDLEIINEDIGLLWQPRIPPGSRPIPWEKGPRGKLPRVLFLVHLEAHEAGISQPNPRGNPRERNPTSRGHEIFLSRSAAVSLTQKRRPRAGAAVPPPPMRRATVGTLPPARRKRGGDAAARRQHGRIAPAEDRGEIQGDATHRRRRRLFPRGFLSVHPKEPIENFGCDQTPPNDAQSPDTRFKRHKRGLKKKERIIV